MNYNYLFIDTETTGMDLKLDSIIQLSGFLRINGIEVESFDWRVKPYNLNPVSLDATAVHGITNDEAQQYPDGKEVFNKFKDMLKRHNICWDNRVFIVGYNVQFDINMLKGLFERYGEFNLWNYIYTPSIDVMQMALIPLIRVRDKMKNFKLSYIYKFLFGKEFEAHNAIEDIRATEQVFDYVNTTFLNNLYPSGEVVDEEGQLNLFGE